MAAQRVSRAGALPSNLQCRRAGSGKRPSCELSTSTRSREGNPTSDLIPDGTGNLYGVTEAGGGYALPWLWRGWLRGGLQIDAEGQRHMEGGRAPFLRQRRGRRVSWQPHSRDSSGSSLWLDRRRRIRRRRLRSNRWVRRRLPRSRHRRLFFFMSNSLFCGYLSRSVAGILRYNCRARKSPVGAIAPRGTGAKA